MRQICNIKFHTHTNSWETTAKHLTLLHQLTGNGASGSGDTGSASQTNDQTDARFTALNKPTITG